MSESAINEGLGIAVHQVIAALTRHGFAHATQGNLGEAIDSLVERTRNEAAGRVLVEPIRRGIRLGLGAAELIAEKLGPEHTECQEFISRAMAEAEAGNGPYDFPANTKLYALREARGTQVEADSDVLAALIAELRLRESHGRRKYGTDLDRTDLSAADLRQHLREELMDALMYSHAFDRAAERAAVPDGWLPIDSAPDDGTPHVRGLCVFSSEDSRFLYWDAYVGRIDTEDGNFIDLGGDQIGWEAMDYTHWHPLSAAPTLAGKEKG